MSLRIIVLAAAVWCLAHSASAGAQPTVTEIPQLERELSLIESEATRIGGGRTVQESLANVEARRTDLEQQLRRMEEAMPRMRASLDEIEAGRREMDERWTIGPGDVADNRSQGWIVEQIERLLGPGARRVSGLIGVVLEIVEIAGKKYIKSVNVAALEEMVRRGEVDLDLVYAIYRAVDIEARMERQKAARLRELDGRWSGAMERLARARQRATADAVRVRERDDAGDRELEREEARERLRVWSVGWSETAAEHRSATGRFVYRCPVFEGYSAGVWGTDLYTYDSSICMAAVHAGFITRDRGGRVTIEMRTAPERFRGSVRNGVSTFDWATISDYRAFAVVGN